jgi:hypothetical protein
MVSLTASLCACQREFSGTAGVLETLVSAARATRGTSAMSQETDYLRSFLDNPAAPSLTVTSAQRTSSRPGSERPLGLGRAMFGWSTLGQFTRNPAGKPVALVFRSAVWYSDCKSNPQAPPIEWQQFASSMRDEIAFTFSIVGSHVHVQARLRSGNAVWDADSFGFDPVSEQLMFRIPGSGPPAPEAVMLASFGPGAGAEVP